MVEDNAVPVAQTFPCGFHDCPSFARYIRPAVQTDEEFLRAEDVFLTSLTESKGITDIADLQPVENGIYLWKGDITTLKCGAIVNAANSQMLGCFQPCHGCIDNAIHTFAGVQLRLKCAEIIRNQGYEEPTGQAKITPAYNQCH